MTRLERLRNQMAQEGVDLVALAPGAHMAWLLDLRPHADERPLLACITADGIGLLIPALEAESARKQTDLPFFEWSDDDGPDTALGHLLQDLGATDARSIVLDECMRADHAGLVQDRLPGAKRIFTETTVGALRMRKEPGEYALMKENALQADHAMEAAWAAMAAGQTELEVAEVVRDSFASQGAAALFAIVGAGANGAMPHHHTGTTVLEAGQQVVMDIGAAYKGYSSDITRMASLGPPSEEYLKVHAVVDAAVEAGLQATRPGVPAHVVDDAARRVITEAGYGEYFVHRTGHGIGSEGHEPPYISASSKVVLDENMTFSIEPGIYMPGKFGLRLEEIVILRADGPEIMSELPRDLRVVG